MTEQEKQFFATQKYFLALADKVAKYRARCQNPPDYLLRSYEDVKRELNDISKALE